MPGNIRPGPGGPTTPPSPTSGLRYGVNVDGSRVSPTRLPGARQRPPRSPPQRALTAVRRPGHMPLGPRPPLRLTPRPRPTPPMPPRGLRQPVSSEVGRIGSSSAVPTLRFRRGPSHSGIKESARATELRRMELRNWIYRRNMLNRQYGGRDFIPPEVLAAENERARRLLIATWRQIEIEHLRSQARTSTDEGDSADETVQENSREPSPSPEESSEPESSSVSDSSSDNCPNWDADFLSSSPEPESSSGSGPDSDSYSSRENSPDWDAPFLGSSPPPYSEPNFSQEPEPSTAPESSPDPTARTFTTNPGPRLPHINRDPSPPATFMVQIPQSSYELTLQTCTVSWAWNGSHPSGIAAEIKPGDVTVTSHRGNDITKTGSTDDPAVHIERSGNDVVKTVSELQVDRKTSQQENGTQDHINGASSSSITNHEPKEAESAKQENGVSANGTDKPEEAQAEAQAGEKRKADEKVDAKEAENPTEENDAKKQKTTDAEPANVKKRPGRPKGSAKKEKKEPRSGQAARKTRSQGKVE